MRRQPPDNDLTGFVIPEKVYPHAEAILMCRAFGNVILQKSPFRRSDGILDVVGFTFLTGATLVDGTGKIHPIVCKRITESLVRADTHPGVTVFFGEDQQGPVNCFDVRLYLSPMPPPSDNSNDEESEERQSGKTDQGNPLRQGKVHAAEPAGDAEEQHCQHNDFRKFDALRTLFDKNRSAHNSLHDCFLP